MLDNIRMFLAPDRRKPEELWLKQLRIYSLIIIKSLEVYGSIVGQEANWQQFCNLSAFYTTADILTQRAGEECTHSITSSFCAIVWEFIVWPYRGSATLYSTFY